MKAIETIATVTPDGKLILELPSALPPGNHKVVLVVDETPLQTIKQPEAAQTSESGTRGNAWDLLESLAGTVDMPEDWSTEHDHYLYGTPKRYSQNSQ